MLRLRSPAARHLLVMLAAVIALDAAAIAVYYLADIPSATAGVRNAFTAAWTIATVIIVGIGLRRIRRARFGR